jgi:hypothetical protein
VFIPEHQFASKPSAAIRQAFSNVCPELEVPNKTAIRWLLTTFLYAGSVCRDKRSSRDEAAEITAVPVSSSASTAVTGHSCGTSVRFVILCTKVFVRSS